MPGRVTASSGKAVVTPLAWLLLWTEDYTEWFSFSFKSEDYYFTMLY